MNTNFVTEVATEMTVNLNVTIIGKSAHGSTPEAGINGATYLALFLNQFDFGGDAKAYLQVSASLLMKTLLVRSLALPIQMRRWGLSA